MDNKGQELNARLICQKQNHNDPIIMVATDESMPILERLFCEKCLQSNKTIVNLQRIDEVSDMIKEKLNQLEHEKTQERIQSNEQQVDNQNKYLDNPQNISQINLINAIKQNYESVPIAFSNDGQIMVAGYDEDVIIWKFDKGQMTVKQKLIGYSETAVCLVFSQKSSWFAWGSRDSQIICWKEQVNGEWISIRPEQQHHQSINHLLLNNNEDELISSSSDKTIKVWKVNCQNNQLDFYYTLENKHTNWVFQISLNESQTYLASCSDDQRIILWSKDNQNKWKYQSEIMYKGWGYRVCFISDYQLVWQPYLKGFTQFLEIKNGTLIKRPELDVFLGKENRDHGYFPTIFNKRKQLIVQKHNKNVYLLKKQENDKLVLVSDPIDCNDLVNYGSLTNDGEYLVVWNGGTKQFKVHQIHYK